MTPKKQHQLLELLASTSFSFSGEQIEEFAKVTEDINILHTSEALSLGLPGRVVPANQIAMAFEAKLRSYIPERIPALGLASLTFRLNRSVYEGETLEPGSPEISTANEGSTIKIVMPYVFRKDDSQKRIEFTAELRDTATRIIKPIAKGNVFLSRKYKISQQDLKSLEKAIGSELGYVPSMLLPSFITSTMLQHAAKMGVEDIGYNTKMTAIFPEPAHLGDFKVVMAGGDYREIKEAGRHMYIFHSQCVQKRRVINDVISRVLRDTPIAEELFRKSQNQA